jgi:hypothetical protein
MELPQVLLVSMFFRQRWCKHRFVHTIVDNRQNKNRFKKRVWMNSHFSIVGANHEINLSPLFFIRSIPQQVTFLFHICYLGLPTV